MAIIGFVVLFIGMLYASAAGFLIFINCVGTYNVGGVPNSLLAKLGAWVVAAVVVGLWYLLLINAPFSISFST